MARVDETIQLCRSPEHQIALERSALDWKNDYSIVILCIRVLLNRPRYGLCGWDNSAMPLTRISDRLRKKRARLPESEQTTEQRLLTDNAIHEQELKKHEKCIVSRFRCKYSATSEQASNLPLAVIKEKSFCRLYRNLQSSCNNSCLTIPHNMYIIWVTM